MKKILIISMFIFSCSQSHKKSPMLVNLDSATTNNDILNVYILNTGKTFYPNGVNDGIEIVCYTDSGDICQKQPIIYKGENLNAKIVRYYPNSKLKYEAQCINGWIEGDVKTYDSLGNIHAKYIYKTGVLNGVSEIYFPNKKLAKILPMNEGKIHGIEKAYHENGNIAFQGEMVNGEKSGEHIYYFSNGKKSAILNYSFGIRPNSFFVDTTEMGFRAHGDFIEFFENGSIKYKAKYVNGRPDGQLSAYYSEGKLDYSEFWQNGHIVGKVESYYENSQIKSTGTFNEQGKENGEWKEYYNNGKLRLRIKFDNGKMIEQHYYNCNVDNSGFENTGDLRTYFPGNESRY